MSIDLVRVPPRSFGGVRRTCARRDIPQVLIAGLDVVWPVVRRQAHGPLGHNIAPEP